MTANPARRRVLVICPRAWWDDLAAPAGERGWDATEVETFSHARLLLSMPLFDAAVVAEPSPGRDFLDNLLWLADQFAAPPILVSPLTAELVPAALRHGCLWLSQESLRDCPDLIAGLLDQ